MITLKKVIIWPKHKFIIYLIIKYNDITYKNEIEIIKKIRERER